MTSERIAPGLCSITLRSLSVEEVLSLSVQAQLEGIEWGSDVHVPPGDLALADKIRSQSDAAGISVSSYGSYLGTALEPSSGSDDVEAVLDTAEALGAPMVRIWTAFGVTPDSPVLDRSLVAHHTDALAEAISNRGLIAALEFHPGTLTQTASSATWLLRELDQPALRCHWQPDPTITESEALAELGIMLPWIAHLHTFSWGPSGIADRLALADGEQLWTRALNLVLEHAAPMPTQRFALLEYVRDDDPAQLIRDATVLRQLIYHSGSRAGT